MPKADKTSRPALPTFSIVIENDPFPRDIGAHVVSITVDDDVTLPGMFSFDLVGSDDRKASWVDSDVFSIGRSVEIKLGYDGDPATVIKGQITALEPEFGVDHLPNLTVRGYDRLHWLQRGRQTRTFIKQKDSDAAETIALAANLTPNVVDSGVMHDYLAQTNQTDFDFLSERAACIGYELRVRGKELLFGPADIGRSAGIVLSLQSDLLAFHPRMSAAGQVNALGLRRWSVADKSAATGEARTGDEMSAMGGEESGPAQTEAVFGSASDSVSRQPTLTQAEADRYARARFNDMALDFITGEGLCWGKPDLLAGAVVQIAEIGRRFSGPYYVTRAKHSYGRRQGYVTEFSVRRNGS